jgi:hypothetical protein
MDTFEDRALSWMAIGLVGLLAWRMTAPPVPAPAPEPRPAPPAIVDQPLRSRVVLVADAIARSEGYYARGIYAGRSLPYFLNNPGLLKATPIVDGELATWRDTGLLVFETPEIGWAALHHQVCLMLTGTSRHYVLEDSLATAGMKYSGGDEFWAVNVAKHLRLPPETTLADLAGSLPDGVTCQTTP